VNVREPVLTTPGVTLTRDGITAHRRLVRLHMVKPAPQPVSPRDPSITGAKPVMENQNTAALSRLATLENIWEL